MVPMADHLRRIYLDGHNNRGFSGGPVVFRASDKGPPEPLRIAGVVSAFQVEPEPVYRGHAPTTDHVRANAGIVIAHDIAYAVSAARECLARSRPPNDGCL